MWRFAFEIVFSIQFCFEWPKRPFASSGVWCVHSLPFRRWFINFGDLPELLCVRVVARRSKFQTTPPPYLAVYWRRHVTISILRHSFTNFISGKYFYDSFLYYAGVAFIRVCSFERFVRIARFFNVFETFFKLFWFSCWTLYQIKS